MQLAGPMLADGYLGDAERTDAAFHRDLDGTRWYRTGDTGEFDGAVLRVTGRRDNVIVSGGINISLDRVERAVHSIRGLEEAVVVGVADEQWGEASVIVVARRAATGSGALLEQARDAVAAEVGRHARPADLVIVDEVPRLSSGKPDRAGARGLAASVRPRSP